jgi:hypothetical protein
MHICWDELAPFVVMYRDGVVTARLLWMALRTRFGKVNHVS